MTYSRSCRTEHRLAGRRYVKQVLRHGEDNLLLGYLKVSLHSFCHSMYSGLSCPNYRRHQRMNLISVTWFSTLSCRQFLRVFILMTTHPGKSWTILRTHLLWRHRRPWTDKRSPGHSVRRRWLHFCKSDHQAVDAFRLWLFPLLLQCTCSRYRDVHYTGLQCFQHLSPGYLTSGGERRYCRKSEVSQRGSFMEARHLFDPLQRSIILEI